MGRKTPVTVILQLLKATGKSLAEKIDYIESAIKGKTLTTKKDFLRLLGVAIQSEKNSSRRYRLTLAMLSDIYKDYSAKKVTMGVINGHEYVELGDGLKWATCNIKLNDNWDSPLGVRWGEISPYSNDSSKDLWLQYKWHNGQDLTKYVTNSESGRVDNRTVLELSDDAAQRNWGGTWRMPTKEEFAVLMDKNKFTWTWDEKEKGFYVKSKIKGYEGNRIFFYCNWRTVGNDPSDSWNSSLLWTSSLCEEDNEMACGFDINVDKSEFQVVNAIRISPRNIRPVSD